MTATVKTSSDNKRSPGKSVSIHKVAVAITTTSSSTAWTNTVQIDGEVCLIHYDIPTFDTHGGDVAVNLNDEDGNEIHRKANLSTAGHTIEKLRADTTPVRFVYVGTLTVQATTASQTVAQDITGNIVLYVKD